MHAQGTRRVTPPKGSASTSRWKPLVPLGAAQFLMVLDTSVMNVSISQLVHDFHTEVSAIQATITSYALVMAAFMVTGGKVGDMLGRRRSFAIGACVYGFGSLLTAVAPRLWLLIVGWAVIEGLGAAMVLPALAALVSGNYQGRDRAVAFGVIGGLSGAGVAVGPLVGGWVTTYLTWRLVFAAEVVIVIGILLAVHWISDAKPARKPRLDLPGSLLSAFGLSLLVLGVLQSSTWGWLQPRKSPFTVFGFSATAFAIGAGVGLLGLLLRWEARQEVRGRDGLFQLRLFRIPALRAALSMVLAQNTVLLGVFFAIPLYLQIVQGLDAFQTGLRLLPISITMFVTATLGPLLSRFASPRLIVRAGVLVLVAAICWILAAMKPKIDDVQFAVAMALLGTGLGLITSQLGNVAQSSVGEDERSEVGGLQYTALNLGSALGTALIGSILIGALATAVSNQVAADSQISATTKSQLSVRLEAGVSFVSTSQVEAALAKTRLADQEKQRLVQHYETAQLAGLKAGLLAAGAIAVASLAFTRRLPLERLATSPPTEASQSRVPEPGPAALRPRRRSSRQA